MFKALKTPADFIKHAVRQFQNAGLSYGHGTDNALDDATFLIMEVMGEPLGPPAKSWLKKKLTPDEKQKLSAIIDRRVETRKPSAYLVKKSYIQGIPFYIDERALIPRSFIGELLFTEDALPLPPRVGTVLDLCTGSGCLALLAAQVFIDAQVDAVDLSADALEVAKRNLDLSPFGGRVTLQQGDLFAPLGGRTYDIIITNPPYVDAQGMAALPDEYRHEPALALGAGDDGLDIVHTILKDSARHMNKGGILICEIGRCAPALIAAYPNIHFNWLETAASSDEVFWLGREDLIFT
jgi:ribosomal protein L3 glutamine methyltransferase